MWTIPLEKEGYHPLLQPPRGGVFQVEFRPPGAATPVVAPLRGITRAERKARLAARHGVKETSDDDLWEFRLLDERTGYLRIGTFVTWNSKRDWKRFLRDAFSELGRKGVPNLVLDLRGNEGGADEVGAELVGYLVPRKVTVPANRTLLRYERVGADLLATLVGQPTGGNLRGTNGGWIAFLRLPRSRIELDLPLKGYFPMDEQPDRGLVPDVVVPESVEDVVLGSDAPLEAVQRLIAAGRP